MILHRRSRCACQQEAAPHQDIGGEPLLHTVNKQRLFQVEKGVPSGVFRHVAQLLLDAEQFADIVL